MTHFLGIEGKMPLDTPEGRTIERIIGNSISLKPGYTFRAFSGFVNFLTSHLGGITDLSNIVTEYLNGLELELSPRAMVDDALNFNTEPFAIEGCDFVCIQWFSGVKITLPYAELSIFLIRFRDLLLSEIGMALFSEMHHYNLTISFYGNISCIRISSCHYLIRVVSFPDLALVKGVLFPNCSKLKSVPPDLPRTVKSLRACFQHIQHTVDGCERWKTDAVFDFTYMFMEYKGAKFPHFSFDSAITIRQMFDGANNIHFPGKELFLHLPKCLDAYKAFYRTTNLNGKIVIHAPVLEIVGEMFGSQAKQNGDIVLVASPKLRIDGNFDNLYSNNVGLKEAFALKQAGIKPKERQLVRPVIISTEELPDMCLSDIFKTLTEPTFLRKCHADGMVFFPKPLSTIERKPNIFGRMKNYVRAPDPLKVFQREFQPGVVASMQFDRHMPCELTEEIILDSTHRATLDFFEGFINEICWLYDMDHDQLYNHIFLVQ